jgi:hypothetical protein
VTQVKRGRVTQPGTADAPTSFCLQAFVDAEQMAETCLVRILAPGSRLDPMRFAHRQRTTFALLILGVWVFALFVGVAHACSSGPHMGSHRGLHQATAWNPGDTAALPECVKFCNEATPLTAKRPSVEGHPAGRPYPLPLTTLLSVDTGVHFAPTLPAPRPPGVPAYLRSLRLAL